MAAAVAAAMTPFVPATAAAQVGGADPIAIRDVLVDRDGDYVPDRIGESAVVDGVVLAPPFVFAQMMALGAIQDRSGGILLVSRDTSALRGLEAGDSIRVRGVVGQHQGGELLTVDGYDLLGRVSVPEPGDALVHEVLGERLHGQLVRVRGTLRARSTQDGRVTATLEDRTGRVGLFISPAWLAEPGFAERLRRGGEVDVVAMAGQSTREDPPTDGYILYPRSTADFAFAPIPPYEYLVLALALLVILGLALWRRATARRAAEFERLAGELERSREELRTREERFRSLVENATDVVSIIDRDGNFRYHSQSLRRVLGWSPEDLTAEPLMEYVHPDDRERAAAFLDGLMKDGGGSGEIELRFRAPDGEWRDLEFVATNRLADAAVRGVVCNARDITRHRELEHRLRQADRLEAVGRLAGGIAHDFNNILTALRGHADMALAEIPDEAPGRDDILEVVRSADRAADVTRQLLAFTRQQERESRAVDVSEVVRQMLPMLRRLIGEDIRIALDLAAGGGRIEADPTQIEQVVLNLVLNARDAMPDGGEITLHVAPDVISRTTAERYPYAVRTGRYIRISVADTGSGMDTGVLAHAFEPFFTTKGPGKGTGLGLATVYGIVKQSGGYIWAQSELGTGTRFDAYFPRLPGQEQGRQPDDAPGTAAAADEPVSPPSDEVSGSGRTVLLVEDEDAVRTLTGRALRRSGYRVLEAATADAALAYFAQDPELEVDLLLTDVVMPGLSGVRLAERLRALRPDLTVLFMSGYTADEALGEDGAAALIEKPFTPGELVRRVHDMLPEVSLVG